jgi:hypothetical protein
MQGLEDSIDLVVRSKGRVQVPVAKAKVTVWRRAGDGCNNASQRGKCRNLDHNEVNPLTDHEAL